jgi:hypothetical protein
VLFRTDAQIGASFIGFSDRSSWGFFSSDIANANYAISIDKLYGGDIYG